MKKKALFIVVSTVYLFGCRNYSSEPFTTVEDRILSDYYVQKVQNTGMKSNVGDEIKVEDVAFCFNYGVYGNTYINGFSINGVGGGKGWFAFSEIEINGVLLHFNTQWLPLAWKNGSFYSLTEAYTFKLLTYNDLPTIKELGFEYR